MRKVIAFILLIICIATAILTGGAEMLKPEQLPEMEELPELLRFENGDEVKTPDDWQRRRAEILNLYSEYM